MTLSEFSVLTFKDATKWRVWLENNHAQVQGVWIRFFKKNSGVKSLTYQEAVEVSLCYGWIDSLLKKYDETSYIQKYTPRRSKSIWSKINTQRAEKLIQEVKMKSAGLQEIEEAKKDGRWQAAYDSPKDMSLPDEFIKMLAKNKKALAFYETLNKTNKYAIAFRIHTAKKPETKVKRMQAIITMLENNQKFYP